MAQQENGTSSRTTGTTCIRLHFDLRSALITAVFLFLFLPTQCPLLPSSSSCLWYILHILCRCCRFIFFPKMQKKAQTRLWCCLSPKKHITKTCQTNSPWPKNFAEYLYLEFSAVKQLICTGLESIAPSCCVALWPNDKRGLLSHFTSFIQPDIVLMLTEFLCVHASLFLDQ